MILGDSGDDALLERWRGGEVAAGQELFERYYGAIERFFLNKVSTGVADLVQETFTECVRVRHALKDPDKFRAFLFSIAYNVLRRRFRRRHRRGDEVDVEEVAVRDVAPGPVSILARRREQRLLLHGLRSIPVVYQVVLELHYWEQLTTAEIGEVVGRPVGTVRSQLRRARQLLEAAMRELAESPALLHSTLAGLEDWAEQCRGQLGELVSATKNAEKEC